MSLEWRDLKWKVRPFVLQLLFAQRPEKSCACRKTDAVRCLVPIALQQHVCGKCQPPKYRCGTTSSEKSDFLWCKSCLGNGRRSRVLCCNAGKQMWCVARAPIAQMHALKKHVCSKRQPAKLSKCERLARIYVFCLLSLKHSNCITANISRVPDKQLAKLWLLS